MKRTGRTDLTCPPTSAHVRYLARRGKRPKERLRRHQRLLPPMVMILRGSRRAKCVLTSLFRVP